jgi:hypothetical protein
VGTPCTAGASCAIDAPAECGQTTMLCKNGVWNVDDTPCPISTARAKRDIAYIDREQLGKLHEETLGVKLATYRYKSGDDAQHLGFIIEDMRDGSPAVLRSRDRVDLYGYVSMAVASLQEQQREIDALKAETARLSAENAAIRRSCAPSTRAWSRATIPPM